MSAFQTGCIVRLLSFMETRLTLFADTCRKEPFFDREAQGLHVADACMRQEGEDS